MGCVHELSERLDVAGLEIRHRLDGAVVLVNRMHRTLLNDRIREGGLMCLEVSIGQITECLNAALLREDLARLLALTTTIVVCGTDQLMLLIGVRHDELHAVEHDRCVLVVQRRAVEEDGIVLLAHRTRELIHDTAVHARVVVLRILTDQREVHVRDIAEAEKIADDEAGQYLEGGTGAEARAVRDVAVDDDVETALELMTTLLERPHHTHRVGDPALLLQRPELVEGRLDDTVAAQIHAVETKLPVRTTTGRRVGTDGQCTRENVTTIVVRMLTDQVHTSRREITLHSIRIAKLLLECLQRTLLVRKIHLFLLGHRGRPWCPLPKSAEIPQNMGIQHKNRHDISTRVVKF